MKFKGGPRGHKFTESPVLQLRLPAWRSRLVALVFMGCFFVLIGRATGVTCRFRLRAARSPTVTATYWPFPRR